MRKLLILIFCMILLVGTVSAMEWDNVKQYNVETQTITIKNSFLRIFPTNEIATIKLNTPLNYFVGAGYGKVAEFELNSFIDYETAFKELEFYHKKGMVKFERDYDYKYKTIEQVPVYEMVCNKIQAKNGTIQDICHREQKGVKDKEVWKDLDSLNFKENDKITIGIFTYVEVGDRVEWIPNFYGERITEWAVWTADLNVGLKLYYNLDETSGTNVDDATDQKDGTANTDAVFNGSVAGIINTDADFTGGDHFIKSDSNIGITGNDVRSFSLWVKFPNTDVVSGYPIIISLGDSDSTGYLFSLMLYDTTDDIWFAAQNDNFNTGFTKHTDWRHYVVTYDGTTTSVIQNDGTPATGTPTINTADDDLYLGFHFRVGSYLNVEVDEVGVWNRTLTVDEIQNLYNNGLGISHTDDFDPVITLNAPVDTANFSAINVTLNATVTDISAVQNVTLFIDGVLNETNNSGVDGDYTFDRILSEGSHNWSIGAENDRGGLANSSVRTFTIDTILPDINLSAPTGQIDAHEIGNTLNLNWSVFDNNLAACWFNYNSTNTTVTCGDNTTTFNTVTGEQSLTFYANDTVGNENSEVTSWTYAFLETGISFNTNVTETSTQTFAINVTTDINVLSIAAILTYNETNDTSTASCSGGNCTISNTIDVSLAQSGELQSHSFFWNLAIFNGTSSTSITTTIRQQNVTRLHLELCNATFSQQSLNFTVYDEQTLVQLTNFTFDGDLDFWIGGGTVKRNNSVSNTSKQTTLCLSPTNETINLNAIIDYDEASGTNYTNRFYYFDEGVINNVSQDVLMYLLKTSVSTSFILKVQDDSLLPVADVLIEIHRFYPGTGEFRIVQIARTDDNGKSIGFFETETVDYKFIIKRDGEILLETGQQKVVPETTPFTLTFNIGEPLGEPWESQQVLEELNSTLVWDEDTGIVTYIYIDSSGNFTLARLVVVKESLVNSSEDSTLCDENLTISSGTLTCNVGSTNGFYVASSFITRDSISTLDKQFSFQIETLSGVVGLLGLFFGWFLILIAAFMFKFNEIAGIWAITVTVFLVNLIGLISFGGVFVTAIIAIAIIITWVMEK